LEAGLACLEALRELVEWRSRGDAPAIAPRLALVSLNGLPVPVVEEVVEPLGEALAVPVI